MSTDCEHCSQKRRLQATQSSASSGSSLHTEQASALSWVVAATGGERSPAAVIGGEQRELSWLQRKQIYSTVQTVSSVYCISISIVSSIKYVLFNVSMCIKYKYKVYCTYKYYGEIKLNWEYSLLYWKTCPFHMIMWFCFNTRLLLLGVVIETITKIPIKYIDYSCTAYIAVIVILTWKSIVCSSHLKIYHLFYSRVTSVEKEWPNSHCTVLK